MGADKISPCLWFDRQAEEAVAFYVSLFPDSSIGAISRYGKGAPLPAGTALTVVFELAGRRHMALNGGPAFTFTPAVSLVIDCDSQAEIDHYWSALTTDGGREGQCGWLTDRYGLSWQVVPRQLVEMLQDSDAARAARVMQAMMQMKKIDIAALERASAGAAP